MATASSRQRFIQMSHRKLRRVVNTIRGKSVPEAYQTLRFMPYFAADIVLRNLKAAVSNATLKYGEIANPATMVVSQVMVDEGPAAKRYKPRAQGRIYQIQKPTAHLTIEVKIQEKTA